MGRSPCSSPHPGSILSCCLFGQCCSLATAAVDASRYCDEVEKWRSGGCESEGNRDLPLSHLQDPRGARAKCQRHVLHRTTLTRFVTEKACLIEWEGKVLSRCTDLRSIIPKLNMLLFACLYWRLRASSSIPVLCAIEDWPCYCTGQSP